MKERLISTPLEKLGRQHTTQTSLKNCAKGNAPSGYVSERRSVSAEQEKEELIPSPLTVAPRRAHKSKPAASTSFNKSTYELAASSQDTEKESQRTSLQHQLQEMFLHEATRLEREERMRQVDCRCPLVLTEQEKLAWHA